MQVTELSAEGLKRQYKVVVPADEIESQVAKRLDELRQTVRMPGFRPGKVPVSLLRKQYGRSVMGEVLEQAVNQGSQKAISDHELRPALQPKIEVTSFDEGANLEFTMAVEVLPAVPTVDLKAVQLTRLTAEVTDEAVTRRLEGLANRLRQFGPPAEPRSAKEGDRLTVSFEGRIEGQPFEGGKAEDLPLVLGSGFMIPGFEEQLVGRSAGDDVTIDVTFPADFPKTELAGKPASFAVQIKTLEEPKPVEIDEALAKSQGFDDLDALQAAVRESIEREYAQLARLRLKRALLDQLAEHYRFEVPAGMVDLEFDTIWKQLQEELERSGDTDTTGKSEDELKAEYRAIADRRVRLGLLLSEIGQANELRVEQAELNAAVTAQARRYPGQEQKVIQYFRSNPAAAEQLRAPLYEDKVVDFVLQMATITEQTASPEELLRDPDEQEDAAPGAAATT
jgi:trigger factor